MVLPCSADDSSRLELRTPAIPHITSNLQLRQLGSAEQSGSCAGERKLAIQCDWLHLRFPEASANQHQQYRNHHDAFPNQNAEVTGGSSKRDAEDERICQDESDKWFT